MQFSNTSAEVWTPDGVAADQGLHRTTHMGIGAHQDDLEIMALDGILKCFRHPEQWFTGVVVTDGGGSPRDALYASYTNEEMMVVRRQEQKKAAFVGEYGAVVFLDHPSSVVKNPADARPVEDLAGLLTVARPQVVYTHNLADKHPTHVAVAMRVVAAIRRLPRETRPRKLYGCEVWRDLDWMLDEDKQAFVLDAHENIAAALVSVFDSQIVGGKRYDLATQGRRRAHATYHQSHAVDAAQLMSFAMDLTPLIEDDSLDPAAYAVAHIERFAESVRAGIVPFAG